MSNTTLILLSMLCAALCACIAQLPDAMEYETMHQRKIARIEPPRNTYGEYMQFTEVNP